MGGADDEDIEDDEDDVVESANKGTSFVSSQFFLWLNTAVPAFLDLAIDLRYRDAIVILV